MSNQKGGMQFFKKFAEKGGMFSNMKIKGPKETKNVAQTQTNFNFSEKSSEQQKSSQSLSRDDFSIKQQVKEIQQPVASEIKPEDLSIKKTKSKPAETTLPTKKTETPEVQVKKIEQSLKETKETKQQKKIEIPKSKPNTSQQRNEVAQQKKSEKSSPTSAVSQRKKSEKVATKKPEDVVTRKPSMNIKQQKKKQEQKSKKSAKEQILDQINQYNVKLAQVVINQKNTQTKICEIKESINELREKISKWTSQQSLCAEREEYDEAERLQNRIQQALNKVDELTTDIGLAQDQLIKLEAQQINILKSQNANLNKIGRKLKLIEIQLQNDAAIIKREEVEKIETLKNKQQIEKKKIQRIEKDISYQSQQISQLEKIVKQEQQIKLNPLLQDKAIVQDEKAELQNEIKQLEKKLKQKKSQLSDTNKHLKWINDSIAEVNESFKEENIKLQQRKNSLQIIENEHENMIIEMNNLEQTIEDQSKIMNAKIEKKLGQAIQISSLAKNFEQKLTTFDDQLENRRVAFDNFTQNGKLLKQFQEKHRSQKDKIKQIQFKKSTISAEMSKLQQKRDAIRKKIPIIEVEQKKFADQKNFKAAGLKKNQIKQLNDQLAMVKQKIQAAIIQEHALGIEEQKLKNAQKQNIEQEQSLQKNLAISQYRYSTIKIQKINEYKEAISKNSAFSSKQKDKIIKQLNEVLNKKSQELKYLQETYLLAHEKHNSNQEEQEIIEADQGNGQIQDETLESKPLTDNNNQQQVDNTNEQQRIEEQAESGYVPLDIPQYKDEQLEQEDEK